MVRCMKENEKTILSILKDEIKPSYGVTEPIAVALASSSAYSQVLGDIKKIKIILDRGLFKNAAFCEVPGSNMRGVAIAALLGALEGNPDLGLGVLKHVKSDNVKKARGLLKSNIVSIEIKKKPNLYVEVAVTTDKGFARAVIKDKHDNIVLIERNRKIVYKRRMKEIEDTTSAINNYRVIDLIDFAKTVPFKDISFVLNAIKMNEELAKEGSTGDWGMGAGAGLHNLIKKGYIDDSLINSVSTLVACAVDARVGGAPKPAMSLVGSGSHGCVASLPIALIAKKRRIKTEKLARATVLSFLITTYLKKYSGRLSAYCGCAITAATGAAVGIVFMLGGNFKQIEDCINNMAGDVTGLLCDGGNFNCSLKCATGASSAVRAALLALEGVGVPKNCGIIGSNVEETIRNMGEISYPGMKVTDEVVVNILSKRMV